MANQNPNTIKKMYTYKSFGRLLWLQNPHIIIPSVANRDIIVPSIANCSITKPSDGKTLRLVFFN